MRWKGRLPVILLCVILVPIMFGCSSPAGTDNILRYNLGPEPETLDPALATGQPELNVLLAAFEGLTRLGPGGKVLPGVARDWSVSPDGRTYTFYLREDARWSNGEPVAAEDFVYAWQRVLQPDTASRYAYQLYPLQNAAPYNSGEITDPALVGVRAVDGLTLQVDLENPLPYFLTLTAFPTYFPVFRPVVEDDPEKWWTKPETFVSNGPFQLTKWETRQRLQLKPNPHYWEADAVKLAGLQFTLVEEPATELALFERGELDMASHLPPGELDRLRREDILELAPDLASSFFMVNTKKQSLEDPLVRRALALAINRRDLVDHVTRGCEEPALAVVPPGIRGEKGADFRQEGGNIIPDAAGSQARDLLAQAGYPGGERLNPVEILIPNSSYYRLIAEAVQGMWDQELGVKSTIIPQEWQMFFSTLAAGDYQVGIVAWNADFLDPVSFLDMWITDGGNNFTGWGSGEFDRLIREAAAELNPDRRWQMLHEAEELLLEDMPMIPLFFPVRQYVRGEGVEGVFLSPLGLVDFKWAELTRGD